MYRRFNFMRLLPVAAALTATLLTVSCKTSESNYRQAYETAVAKNREASGVDSTIYARIRNSAQTSDLIAGSDTLPMRTEYVGYTENGGASREMLKRYNVVVGQFKQKFNAREMRARLQSQRLSRRIHNPHPRTALLRLHGHLPDPSGSRHGS